MMGVPSLRRGVVLHQLLNMIWKWFGKYSRVLGTFKELLDFLTMGAITGKMEFPTYLTRVLNLAFIVSSGVLIFRIVLLLLGFSFLLLAGGWCGLNRIHLFGFCRIFSFSASRIRVRGLT